MRLGTRASALALAQANLVADMLGDCQIIPIVTSGDRASAAVDAVAREGTAAGADTAAAADAMAGAYTAAAADAMAGAYTVRGEDKSRWVKELEGALLRGEIDVAVHSAKDVPCEPVDGLALAGAPARAAVQDVLCGADGLDRLPAGARVGTSSLRRTAQLCAARPDLRVLTLTGNVDTRLGKLERGLVEAIVLARAGLQRLGREEAIGAVLDPVRFVPAPGQGTLALQARADDARTGDALAAITHPPTLASLRAERALARALDASCETPLGAHAEPCDGGLLLRGWVGLVDGSQWAADALAGDLSDPEALGRELAARLELVGAVEILRAARERSRVDA
jgi:hydroxymethylbilane synthase